MYLRQRQEQQRCSSIQGRRIINQVTYYKKDVRTLSPQVYEPLVKQQTFQTDSFKQILTRRSGGHISSKENLNINQKLIKKNKQELMKDHQGKKISKNKKKLVKKSQEKSYASLNRYTKNSTVKDMAKRQQKSFSPPRDHHQYRSGPVDLRKNYISNNPSKTSRDIVPCRSEKNLTDRIRNPLQSLMSKQNNYKRKSPDHIEGKKVKNKKQLKGKILSKQPSKKNSSCKIESIAKQFDALIKNQNGKKNKKKLLNKSKHNKSKKSKSKQKSRKIILSNNTKIAGQRLFLGSDFQSDSQESPQKLISTKYCQNKVKSRKRQRHSFQPNLKNQKQKRSQKVKTQHVLLETYSKDQALHTISKFLKTYLVYQQYEIFRRFNQSALKIQKVWRGYVVRKNLKGQFQNSKQILNSNRKKNSFKLNLNDLLIIPKDKQDIKELQKLLYEILSEQNVNQKIKQKITEFLNNQKSAKSSSRSLKSFNQKQIQSQKKFFEEYDKNKAKYDSPLSRKQLSSVRNGSSSRLSKSQLQKSPEIMIQNLVTIKEFHREKLINHAQLQKQGVDSLAMKNIFSPKTHSLKKKQIDQKLYKQLEEFDVSMQQVIRSCQKDAPLESVRPFSGVLTPQHQRHQSIQINESEKKIQDLSVELLEYYQQKSKVKEEIQYQPINNTCEFIDEYLINLFEFLLQKGGQAVRNFLRVMATPKNLPVALIMNNLVLVTESCDDDDAFKLPMYKYLESEEKQLITRMDREQYNKNNIYGFSRKRQIILEDIYLKMLVDCVNQALYLERPLQYIFTDAIYLQNQNRLDISSFHKTGHAADEQQANEEQFQLIFAKSMNHIYKWAHSQCGLLTDQQIDEDTLFILRQKKIKHLLNEQTEKKWLYYDELVEIIVEIGQGILQSLVQEANIQIIYM